MHLVGFEQLREQPAGLDAEDALHGRLGRLQHGDSAAVLPRGRGDLRADEPAADHGQHAAVGQSFAEPQRVVEGAQRADGRVLRLAGQPPGLHARRDDDDVGVDATAVAEFDPVGVHRDGHGAQPQRHLQSSELLERPQPDLV